MQCDEQDKYARYAEAQYKPTLGSYHLIPNQKALLDSPYYHGEMYQTEANKLLVGRPVGTFLLRKELGTQGISISYREDYKLYPQGIPFGPNPDRSFTVPAIMHESYFLVFSHSQEGINGFHKMNYNVLVRQ